MVSKKLLEEVEYYSNHPWDEVKDDIKTDTEKLDALNKGIDELIKKYEEEFKILGQDGFGYDFERYGKWLVTENVIQDLKKLKGE